MIVHPLAVDLDVATASFYDADGFLGIGIAGVAAKVALVTPEAHHPLGILARPLDPQTDGAGNPGLGCTVLRLSEGGSDHVIALGDPRVTPKLPQLEKGAALFYAPNGEADPPRILADVTGAMTIHVPTGQQLQLESAGGALARLTDALLELGALGGGFVVIDNGGALTTALAALQSVLATHGIAWTAPTGIVATKVKAT